MCERKVYICTNVLIFNFIFVKIYFLKSHFFLIFNILLNLKTVTLLCLILIFNDLSRVFSHAFRNKPTLYTSHYKIVITLRNS